MEDALAASRDQQLALTRAFEVACTELGIAGGSLDVWKKERLARILESLAQTGDWDWSRLAEKAVTAFTADPRASPTRSSGTET